MATRKLKLIWQQVHDSTSYLYQPWSFLNIDKPRTIPTQQSTTNDLRNVFITSSMPIISNVQSSMINSEQSSLINTQTISKPSVYQTPMDTSNNMFLQPSPPVISQPTSIPFTPIDSLPKTPQINMDIINQPILQDNEQQQQQQQQRKRQKLMDTRPVEIDVDEDEDGAERK